MDDLWLWIPTIVTAIATVVLAIVTGYYAWELRRKRLESVKPVFSLRPSFMIRGEPMKLCLLNSGELAKDVVIDVMVDGTVDDSLYVISIPKNGEVSILSNLNELREKLKKISIEITYKDINKNCYNETLNLDYPKWFNVSRRIGYNYTSNEKMLEYIGNGLTVLHNDAVNGKFKSDNITVYPTEKPKRGSRKK